MIKNGYQGVGEPTPFGNTKVVLEDVEPIRYLATCLLPLIVPAYNVHLNPNWTKLRYTLRLLEPVDFFDMETADQRVSVLSDYQWPTRTWQLGVHFRTSSAADRYSSKWTHYKLEVMGEQVLQATKDLYVVKGTSWYGVDEKGEPYATVDTERTVQEWSLEPADCQSLAQQLERTAKLARALVHKK